MCDRNDLVSKYQHEASRVNEQNRKLLRLYEQNEQTQKELQSRNELLQQKLEE